VADRSDTFASFLTALELSLDEHATSAEKIAGRLHVSPYHFTRIVSAVAGEPPAAMRRRILLERAAYRLHTTDDDLIEIAAEAGYASHEAFTRAFARAFGKPPSLWRSGQSRFEIPAANQVHFKPPAGLWLPAQRKLGDMHVLTRMVEHHIWLVGEMLTRAESLDDTVLDSPITLSVSGIDDAPTLRSLLSRLVGQLGMWVAAAENRSYDFESEQGASVADMRERLAECAPSFLTLVREVVEGERLDETFVDAICDPPEVFTWGGMIAHVLTFAAHRRTLVAGALHDAGIDDLDSIDPMLWVAEHA
jgi:AraC-like DNA-binding protein